MCIKNLRPARGGQKNRKYGYKNMLRRDDEIFKCQFAKQLIKINKWTDPEPEMNPPDTAVEFSRDHIGYFSIYTSLDGALETLERPLVTVKVEIDDIHYVGYKHRLDSHINCGLCKRIKIIKIVNNKDRWPIKSNWEIAWKKLDQLMNNKLQLTR